MNNHGALCIPFGFVFVLVFSQLGRDLSCQEKAAGQTPPTKIGRLPSKPTHTPRHAAIEFGAKGQHRIWLAVEGPAFRVDRNADGDLLDPGERIAPNDRGVFVTEVLACHENGQRAKYILRVSIGRDRNNQPGVKSLSVSPVGDIQQFHTTAGFIPLGIDRAGAPHVSIHGPLRFVLMDHWTGSTACRMLPRGGGKHELSILVATPVRTPAGEAYVYPNLWVLEGGKLPAVRVEFVSGREGPAIVPSLKLWRCECARRYRCSFRAPPVSAALQGRVHVSFPGWRHGSLPPATFDLPYAAAAGSEAAAKTTEVKPGTRGTK